MAVNTYMYAVLAVPNYHPSATVLKNPQKKNMFYILTSVGLLYWIHHQQQISPANILVTLLPAKPQNQESYLNVASPLCCGLFMLILGFTLGCVLTAA